MLLDTLNFGILIDPLLACDVCAKAQIEVSSFCREVQALGHTLISLNRFSCFCSTSLHTFLWKGRMGKAIRLLPVLVPLAKLFVWLPQRGSYKPYFSTGYYTTLYDDPAWMEHLVQLEGLVICATSVTSLLLGLCATIRLYGIRLGKGAGVISTFNKSDARLLAHSLAMFVIQSLVTLQYLLLLDHLPSFLVPFVRVGARPFVDAYNLSGPVFLLLLRQASILAIV
ncbi:hypothetical protein AAVH_22454 [Aphelenchoides avenae]|nr:hypothetical protein AAVH_22454 [Aphelenchus avenae]